MRLGPFARRHRRALIWGGLVAALAGALAFVPLFDSLGYELSFVVAIVVSVAAADLGAARVRRERTDPSAPRDPARPMRAVLALAARASLAALSLLVAPALIMTINALRVRQCDFASGYWFYLAMPGISSMLGSIVGVVAGLAIARRPRLAIAAAWLFVVASLAIGVWRFYAGPAIFGYDPFAGYYAGTLYDEDVTLGAPFWWARLYHVAFAGAALAASAALIDVEALALRRKLPRDRRATLAATVVFAIPALVAFARSGDLGFAVTADDVAAHLGGKRETAHFVIFYPEGAPFEDEMDAIAAEHEFRWAQLARTLGVAPREKITSFYFGSADEKARWMGAKQTYIAKPWRKEIYVQHDDFPHHTLRHEIAHVFAGEFGDPVFQVSVKWWAWPPAQFNVGLIEGIAVAADWPATGRLTPHQSVKAMSELNLLPPLDRVLATGFFQFSAAQSYTTAGSFARFLLDRYGAEKLRAIYREGGTRDDFEHVYEKPLAELEREWRAVVDAQPLTDEDREIARDRYRRRSIFHRPCPHAIARRAARAGEHVADGELPRAIALWRRICRDDPGEPNHRLSLAGVLDDADRTDDAIAIYRDVADSDATTPVRARALLALVDLLARRGDLAGAADAVRRALALPVDEATRRNLSVRALALDGALAATPAGATLRVYFFGREDDRDEVDGAVMLSRAHEVAAHPETAALGAYLVGRNLEQRGAYADAARFLARAAERGLTYPLVARENDRLLSSAAFLSGDLDGAAAAAARLADAAQPIVVQWEARDWLERIAFARTGALPP